MPRRPCRTDDRAVPTGWFLSRSQCEAFRRRPGPSTSRGWALRPRQFVYLGAFRHRLTGASRTNGRPDAGRHAASLVGTCSRTCHVVLGTPRHSSGVSNRVTAGRQRVRTRRVGARAGLGSRLPTSAASVVRPYCFVAASPLTALVGISGRTFCTAARSGRPPPGARVEGVRSDLFVALTRVPNVSAREVSEAADVPRTRVYDAIRVLEAEGLVGIQHSYPERFRAVSIDGAARTVRDSTSHVSASSSTSCATSRASSSTNTRPTSPKRSGRSPARPPSRTGPASSSRKPPTRSSSVSGGRRCSTTTSSSSSAPRGLRERVESELPRAEVFVSGLEWVAAAGDDPSSRGRTELPAADATEDTTVAASS